MLKALFASAVLLACAHPVWAREGLVADERNPLYCL